jgi:pyruvate-formate lyase-activating enzyme
MVNPRVVLDLVEHLGKAARGATVSLPLPTGDPEQLVDAIAAWCAHTGNELLSVRDGVATLRRGPPLDPLTGITPKQLPGTRLWLYTNFDCNLACDYCCARSSPRALRRALGIDRVRALAAEAAHADVSELLLTGGEPFLLTDIDELANACTTHLPTTLLTNGMLFHGTRLQRLRRMDHRRLALQISLDSATPELHDQHRGRGSWARAVTGIHTARQEGFRVRVAATLPPGHTHDLASFRGFLDGLGIAPEDQVIRALAHRGAADHGIELTTESLIPELTVTAAGVYWHPVSADHDDQLVTRELFPLAAALAQVRQRFLDYRAHALTAAQWFPCA